MTTYGNLADTERTEAAIAAMALQTRRPTMRTLELNHQRRMNYARQFGSRFLTGGWYRQMVVGHYHSHKTTIKTLRGAQWIYYAA